MNQIGGGMKMSFFFSGAFWGVLLILWGLSLVLKAFFPSIRMPIGTIFVSVCIIIFGVQLLIGGFGSRRHSSERRAHQGISEHQSSNFKEELNVVFTSDSLNLQNIDVSNQDKYLEVNAVFGRAIIYVTSDMPIKLESNAVFGKVYKDSRLKLVTNGETALIVEATAVFGSVDIIVLDN